MITLASDFGSPYPAAMAGVIYGLTDARVVDVTHELPRQDVRGSAFWLGEILPYYPPAVHAIVVDPGVGTDRRALVCRAGEHVLVGPDNGVLVPVADHLAEDGSIEWFAVDDGDADSRTFHGRDVFAPMAARVHDTPPDELSAIADLTAIESPVEPERPEPTIDGDRIRGTVLVVDDFGNCVTNVPGSVLDGRAAIRLRGERLPIGETFDAVDPGDVVALVGSHGNVEFDVNRGRGDERLGLAAGDEIEFELLEP